MFVAFLLFDILHRQPLSENG